MTAMSAVGEKLLCLLLLLAVLSSVNARTADGQDNARGHQVSTSANGRPWPMPKTYKVNGTLITVDAVNFAFTSYLLDCDILDAAYKRYTAIIFGHTGQSKNKEARSLYYQGDWMLSELGVYVANPCHDVYPRLESDESYELNVTSSKASLFAADVWGALRGLETFSQIVTQSDDGQFMVQETQIQDAPRFPHRGLLLDTGRHFLKKEVILENLEAMAQNKFNVFHWHLVDDPSFPYYSIWYPHLSGEGAFSKHGHVYTPADVQEIIEFARLRGIRVMPEFDTPGHTQSWGKGQPDLLTKCCNDNGQPNGLFGPIDPSHNHTYVFLRNLFTEVSQTFPDNYIFLGGDEVNFLCWKNNPNITKFMKSMGFGRNFALLEQYYMQKVVNMVAAMDKGYIIWQEVIDNRVKVSKDTVVDIWKPYYQAELAKVTKLGYKTILSACWYLNKITYGSDWQAYYNCDPQNFDGTPQQKALIVGGEAAMWGEFVDDTNLMPRLWPRASAVGERLWSSADVTDVKAAGIALAAHRCRMVKRGFRAEEVIGPGFCDFEF